ncbi:MAG: cbb3-type cytochrome oxidase assembly protein CcoS [Weeksellaceae bacterium]|jgi:cbb3-type cytochrome oxidase maturation protein|nr:cbb3-type cytochrome oxidase assembly protein CcoS [Weeksellaceae bacterium]
MGIIILMILVSVSLAGVFLALFLIGAKKGQFDEDESPSVRMLMDDKKIKDKDKKDK